jgi:predicted esterase
MPTSISDAAAFDTPAERAVIAMFVSSTTRNGRTIGIWAWVMRRSSIPSTVRAARPGTRYAPCGLFKVVKKQPMKLAVLLVALLVGALWLGRSVGSESVSAEMLEERDGYQRLVLHRETATEVRDIVVEVSHPTDHTERHPVFIVGGYRNGFENVKNDPIDTWALQDAGAIVVRIGFPHMNQTGFDIQYRDIKNHPSDVKAVLEYVQQNAETFGEMSGRHVWYGASMGAITGLVISAEDEPVVQLDAVLAVGGFLPQKDQGFPSPVWSLQNMQNVLLVASQTDQTVPYQLSVRTYRELTQAGVEARLLTRRVGPHAIISDCRALEEGLRAWTLSELGVGGPSSGTAGSCAVPGELPGGTSGLGLAALISSK